MIGLSVSQVGYNTYYPKTAYVKTDELAEVTYQIIDKLNNIVKQGVVETATKKWNYNWFKISFDEIDIPGTYHLIVNQIDKNISEKFEIGNFILESKTFNIVGIDQFKLRSEYRGNSGWLDCGSNIKESYSHALAIIGLSYSIEYYYDQKNGETDMINQIIHGVLHIESMYKRSLDFGYPEGTIIHESFMSLKYNFRESILCGIAMIRASKIVYEYDSELSLRLIEKANKVFNFSKNSKYNNLNEFQKSLHGAAEDYKWDGSIATSDIMLLTWLAHELTAYSKYKYFEYLEMQIDKIQERQVLSGKQMGNFYTFDDRKFTEKLFIHHRTGMDMGGVLQCFVAPFVEITSDGMASSIYSDDLRNKFSEMIKNYCKYYYIPSCKQNPFNLPPMGYFNDELLNFCGPWHGFNASILFSGFNALRMQSVYPDNYLEEVAVSCIQWVCGVNSLVDSKALDGSLRFDYHIPKECALSFSMIDGVGNRYVNSWRRIPGSIINGFSTNLQFTFNTLPSKSNDEPKYLNDEDWIPHAAGYICLLSFLNVKQSWTKKYHYLLDNKY